jgi:hypothetical protein
VRTNSLCIGGACKTAWPAAPAPTDIVAEGILGRGQRDWGVVPCCGSPGYWVNNIPASYISKYDPRGVLGVTNNYATCPGPSGCTQQYPTWYSATCSGGFRAGSTSLLDNYAGVYCGATQTNDCRGAACFHP